jgi:hypothetical protein
MLLVGAPTASLSRIARFGGAGKEAKTLWGVLVMIERSVDRRALPREIINLPALLSFDGISGVHPCVVHDTNVFGACLSTPYYMFANDFDLSFEGFHRTFACRVAWRRATLSGVVFVLRRRALKSVSAKVELASIIQLNRPDALRGARCGHQRRQSARPELHVGTGAGPIAD